MMKLMEGKMPHTFEDHQIVSILGEDIFNGTRVDAKISKVYISVVVQSQTSLVDCADSISEYSSVGDSTNNVSSNMKFVKDLIV